LYVFVHLFWSLNGTSALAMTENRFTVAVANV
jgi:hypothetical protein